MGGGGGLERWEEEGHTLALTASHPCSTLAGLLTDQEIDGSTAGKRGGGKLWGVCVWGGEQRMCVGVCLRACVCVSFPIPKATTPKRTFMLR